MHRLLAVLVCLCCLAATAAGCPKTRRPDDDARELSRQAEEPEGEASPESRGGEAAAARRADRAPATEEEPPEPPADGIGTGAGARERKMKGLVEEGAVVEPSELGYFMDVHEASLRGATEGTEITLGRHANRFRLGVPGAECFPEGSDELSGSIRGALGSLAGVLAEYDKTLVTVVAHAVDRELSMARARAVARFLGDGGVAAERLAAIGRGSSNEADGVEIVVEPVLE